MKYFNVLFVCTGNICRSPTADGVLRHMVKELGWQHQVQVDSAGTHDYHVGEPADYRSQKHAVRRGYDMSALRARLVVAEDFEHFDLILAMDTGHMEILRDQCPETHKTKLHYFTEFCSASVGQDVPDPYYGNSADFEQVLDMVVDGCSGIVQHIRARP
jgi:protein-tyrosine phosphatase